MNTPNSSDYTAQAVVNNQSDLAEGLFVLELEERLEMAALAEGGDRCIVVNH